MTTESKDRINAAAKACDEALKEWRAAVKALGENVSVNGAGVLHDEYELRRRLLDAQTHITASVAALNSVKEWPTDIDYDRT